MTRLNDKKKALELRRQGKSYNEIMKTLSVPKSTLSNWLGPLGWSIHIKKTLNKEQGKKHTVRIKELNKTRGILLKRAYQQAEIEAIEDFERLKYHPLFIAALIAYWGEGDRVSNHHVRIVNVDPRMLRLFVVFLTDICCIPQKKIKVALHLYKDLDENISKKYWSQQVGLSELSFFKSIFLRGKHKSKKVSYGICTIYFSSSYFKVKMMTWLELLPKALLSEDYYKYK